LKKIRVLRSTGSDLPQFTEGQVAEVDEATAELLCKLNLAEVIKAIPPKPVAAVPDEPGIQADQDKPKRKRRTKSTEPKE